MSVELARWYRAAEHRWRDVLLDEVNSYEQSERFRRWRTNMVQRHHESGCILDPR